MKSFRLQRGFSGHDCFAQHWQWKTRHIDKSDFPDLRPFLLLLFEQFALHAQRLILYSSSTECQNLNFSPFGSFQEAVESFAQRPQPSLWAQFAVFVDLLTEVQMGTFNVLATFSWNAVAAVSSFLFTAFTLLVLSRVWTLTGDTPRELKYSERSQWSVSSDNDCLRIDVFISFIIVWLIVTFWSLKHATNNLTRISKHLFPWS